MQFDFCLSCRLLITSHGFDTSSTASKRQPIYENKETNCIEIGASFIGTHSASSIRIPALTM